jgi:3-mercaptopyruvate sulfurtransferase SseA
MGGTISTNDLKAKLDRKEAIKVVETLAPERYREAHIPGALNIPPERIKELVHSCCPTRTLRLSRTARIGIDTPANTLPVNCRRWATVTCL